MNIVQGDKKTGGGRMAGTACEKRKTTGCENRPVQEVLGGPNCCDRSLVVGGVVEPLEALHGRDVIRDGGTIEGQGGGRKPRRSKVVLSEAAVEENVTSDGVDVLNLVLNAATDSGCRC